MDIRFRWAMLLLMLCGCSSAPHATDQSRLLGKTTVVWISIDGFRHDYLARFHPPKLSRLAAEGAFTLQEMPIFPSLTFPNHISQVTGVGVDGHGIPMNSYFDEADGQTHAYPNESSLLRAEPIWNTAQRQGVKTICIGWPVSYAQTGANRAAYFDNKFDKEETDRHRLDRILDQLNEPSNRENPFRLIMGYMSNVDHIGHEDGPDSPQLAAAVAEADQTVQHFTEGVITWFNSTHLANDELVMIFSTDHGITPAKVQVNLDRLIGADLAGSGTQIVLSGPVATIHCPPDRVEPIVKRLSAYSYLTAWKAADVPAADHFSDPTRIGQVVVILKLGYNFTKPKLSTTMPERRVSGMHGYDPAESPDLLGSAVIWRLRHRINGRDLGPMVNTQWDATVCKLLNIQPPSAADPRAIVIP